MLDFTSIYKFMAKRKHWFFGLLYCWPPIHISIWHYNERAIEIAAFGAMVSFFIHLWAMDKADEVENLKDKQA